jgi:hypothetical protein
MVNIENKFKSLVNFKTNLSYPRHRWFNIKEGFSRKLIVELINEYCKNKDNFIFDPFLGSGTTTLTSSEIGYKSIGIEQNPFLYYLSKVKCSNFASLENFNSYFDQFNKRNKEEKIDEPKLSISKKLFGEQLGDILNVSSWIESINDEEIRDIFNIAYLCSLDHCSFAKKDGNGLRYPKNRIPKKFTTFFSKKLEEIKNDIFHNNKLLTTPEIYNNSCLKINSIDHFFENYQDKIQLTVFSPPYVNCFDYYEVYKTELWFGKFIKTYEDLKELKLNSLSSHLNKKIENIEPIPEITNYLNKLNSDNLWSKKIPSMLISYFSEMENLIKLIFNLSKKSDYCIIVIGNSAYSNVVFPTDIIFEKIGKRVGFKKTDIITARKLSTSSQQYHKVNRPDLLRESLLILKK